VNSGLIDVETTDDKKIGLYKFKITCWWAEVSTYKKIFYTTVDVVNMCADNIIGSVQ